MQENYRKLSDLQRIYFWHLLTAQTPKAGDESVSQAVIQAKVDLNPHQVEAALFAFRNPLDGGVLLADEVGLGKTIETGLILSQLWAQGRRNFLIISPKSLRHQWQYELKSLFYLDSEIVDTSKLREIERGTVANPFLQKQRVVITNEHFIEKNDRLIANAKWDLIVIDEAHRFRNVWRSGKGEAKRAKKVRETILSFRKLLLTATPMQNNLMELYGLVSFVDQHILGTAESFQRTFVTIPEEVRPERLNELRERMKMFFKRELRRNVREYIPYTNRHAKLFTYSPTEDEEKLRREFEDYLRAERSIAIPASASHLIKFVYFKLLASSSFALKNSLLNLYSRLVLAAVSAGNRDLYDQLLTDIANALTLSNGRKTHELERFEKSLFKGVSPKNFDGLYKSLRESLLVELTSNDPEIEDVFEIDLQDTAEGPSAVSFSKEELIEEAKSILGFIGLSRTIKSNTKGKALTDALDLQFKRAREQGWPEKAVIFTEFRSTQDYVLTVLEQYGLDPKQDVVIFNGSSGDAESRGRLVREFKNSKKIFLTTEAGAEGLNLQFCNLLINYDLPWNPQRIEQRIGRCHRYGQRLDVIVINFVNEQNIADRRVLELLSEKFSLFEGAFGASDEVLGQIESGLDIEKNIFELYLKCRTEQEIRDAFSELMSTNRDNVDRKMDDARRALMESFDEEVQRKLRTRQDHMANLIDSRQQLVRDVLLSSMKDGAFVYQDNVLLFSDGPEIDSKKEYTFLKRLQDSAELIHGSHDLFLKSAPLNATYEATFRYSGNHNIAAIKDLVGANGYYGIFKLSVRGLDTYESIVPVFMINQSGAEDRFLDAETSDKLLTVTSEVIPAQFDCDPRLTTAAKRLLSEKVAETARLNGDLYQEEIQKIEVFFEDVREQKRYEIEDLEKALAQLKKERTKVPFQEQRKLNAEIQKLKDQIENLEAESVELRRTSRVAEKEKLAGLERKVAIQSDVTCLSSGYFKIR